MVSSMDDFLRRLLDDFMPWALVALTVIWVLWALMAG
jgi:hypothetical protein